jgi:chemotaxis protein CheY-P-specific phosphatase CheC
MRRARTGRRSARDLDRLGECLSIGAGHAAGVLAELSGRTFWMQVPRRYRRVAPPALGRSATAALFFELEGGLAGLVALLLPPCVCEVLLLRLLGPDAARSPASLRASALRELGNLVVSHLCSAIADTLGTRILPSVPALAPADGEARLARRLERRSGPVLETELRDGSGRLRGRLVFAPDAGL